MVVCEAANTCLVAFPEATAQPPITYNRPWSFSGLCLRQPLERPLCGKKGEKQISFFFHLSSQAQELSFRIQQINKETRVLGGAARLINSRAKGSIWECGISPPLLPDHEQGSLNSRANCQNENNSKDYPHEKRVLSSYCMASIGSTPSKCIHSWNSHKKPHKVVLPLSSVYRSENWGQVQLVQGSWSGAGWAITWGGLG